MTISMYQAAVPVFVRALSNLAHVMRKGEAHARAKNVTDEVMLGTRLVPDMLPLRSQVQIATDMCRRGAARLAGAEPASTEDTETTFEQLYDRIDHTIEYLETLEPALIDGGEGREIVLNMRHGEMKFDGQTYLLHFLIPNIFFHCATAYDILRQAGVELGKADFFGRG